MISRLLLVPVPPSTGRHPWVHHAVEDGPEGVTEPDFNGVFVIRAELPSSEENVLIRDTLPGEKDLILHPGNTAVDVEAKPSKQADLDSGEELDAVLLEVAVQH